MKNKTPLWQKLALITVGTGFALLLATLVLSFFPGLLRGKGPEQRKEANTVIEVEFRPSNGDLFTSLPGKIRPPTDDALLAAFTLRYDQDSFRIPAREADHYPIAAFGDSFTEGTNVALPWPDKLAELLNVPVQNYGYRSYGPLEARNTVHEFAVKEDRSWILYAFFAGNDLGDANRSANTDARSPLYLLPQLAAQAAREMSTRVARETSDHYDFPLPIIISGNYYDMAFLTYYLWRQLAPPEGFAASKTFTIFSDALDSIQHDTPDTCRALIFIPTKEQLYYPYIHPDERQWLRANAYRGILDNNGYLQLELAPITEAEEPEVMRHFTDQRDAVQALIESKPGWHFIDLLPAFQQHVEAGELLYYPYDTHWNQAGHALAAQIIAQELPGIPGCSSP